MAATAKSGLVKIAKIGSVLGVTVLVLWVIWNSLYPSYQHRYRLICEVEVDGQTHVGSSVFEITWITQPPISQTAWNMQIKGNAVVVELGDRGAILVPNYRVDTRESSGQSLVYLAIWAFKDHLPSVRKTGVTGPALAALSRVHGKAKLAPDELPQIVWLKDINDPSTAQLIMPDQFTQIIGGNAHLNSISVEMTDENPTLGSLSDRLPWFDEMLEKEIAERQKKNKLQRGRAHQPYHLMALDLIGWQNEQ